MNTYLIIFLYIAYQKGRYKGQIEAYDDCLEELEKLKKFMEKEK